MADDNNSEQIQRHDNDIKDILYNRQNGIVNPKNGFTGRPDATSPKPTTTEKRQQEENKKQQQKRLSIYEFLAQSVEQITDMLSGLIRTQENQKLQRAKQNKQFLEQMSKGLTSTLFKDIKEKKVNDFLDSVITIANSINTITPPITQITNLTNSIDTLNKSLTGNFLPSFKEIDITSAVNSKIVGDFNVAKVINDKIVGEFNVFSAINSRISGTYNIPEAFSQRIKGTYDLTKAFNNKITGGINLTTTFNKRISGGIDLNKVLSSKITGKINLSKIDISTQVNNLFNTIDLNIKNKFDKLDVSNITLSLQNKIDEIDLNTTDFLNQLNIIIQKLDSITIQNKSNNTTNNKEKKDITITIPGQYPIQSDIQKTNEPKTNVEQKALFNKIDNVTNSIITSLTKIIPEPLKIQNETEELHIPSIGNNINDINKKLEQFTNKIGNQLKNIINKLGIIDKDIVKGYEDGDTKIKTITNNLEKINNSIAGSPEETIKAVISSEEQDGKQKQVQWTTKDVANVITGKEIIDSNIKEIEHSLRNSNIGQSDIALDKDIAKKNEQHLSILNDKFDDFNNSISLYLDTASKLNNESNLFDKQIFNIIDEDIAKKNEEHLSILNDKFDDSVVEVKKSQQHLSDLNTKVDNFSNFVIKYLDSINKINNEPSLFKEQKEFIELISSLRDEFKIDLDQLPTKENISNYVYNENLTETQLNELAKKINQLNNIKVFNTIKHNKDIVFRDTDDVNRKRRVINNSLNNIVSGIRNSKNPLINKTVTGQQKSNFFKGKLKENENKIIKATQTIRKVATNSQNFNFRDFLTSYRSYPTLYSTLQSVLTNNLLSSISAPLKKLNKTLINSKFEGGEKNQPSPEFSNLGFDFNIEEKTKPFDFNQFKNFMSSFNKDIDIKNLLGKGSDDLSKAGSNKAGILGRVGGILRGALAAGTAAAATYGAAKAASWDNQIGNLNHESLIGMRTDGALASINHYLGEGLLSRFRTAWRTGQFSKLWGRDNQLDNEYTTAEHKALISLGKEKADQLKYQRQHNIVKDLLSNINKKNNLYTEANQKLQIKFDLFDKQKEKLINTPVSELHPSDYSTDISKFLNLDKTQTSHLSNIVYKQQKTVALQSKLNSSSQDYFGTKAFVDALAKERKLDNNKTNTYIEMHKKLTSGKLTQNQLEVVPTAIKLQSSITAARQGMKFADGRKIKDNDFIKSLSIEELENYKNQLQNDSRTILQGDDNWVEAISSITGKSFTDVNNYKKDILNVVNEAMLDTINNQLRYRQTEKQLTQEQGMLYIQSLINNPQDIQQTVRDAINQQKTSSTSTNSNQSQNSNFQSKTQAVNDNVDSIFSNRETNKQERKSPTFTVVNQTPQNSIKTAYGMV